MYEEFGHPALEMKRHRWSGRWNISQLSEVSFADKRRPRNILHGPKQPNRAIYLLRRTFA